MTCPARFQALLDTLSPEQMGELNRVVIPASFEEDSPVTMRDCLSGFTYKVGRIRRDALLTGDSYEGWTEWDWFAVLHNRSRVEKEIPNLSPDLRERVANYVEGLDRDLIELTERDTRGLVRAVAARLHEELPVNAGWWSRRIPKQGSIRECFDEYLRR